MTGQSRALALISIALGVVVLLGVNILSNLTLTSARFDLTESRIYTLSEGSRNILENLAEPVTLRFFASRRALDRIPGFGSYAARVEELLMEYARRSGGTIDLVIIDPEPFSEEEDRALGYGLQGIPLDGQEERLYFGLVGTGPTDEEEVIPFFCARTRSAPRIRPHPAGISARTSGNADGGPGDFASDGGCRTGYARRGSVRDRALGGT